MKLKIYRGTHQIGGCITEITTNNARILIDFGAELEDSGSTILVDGVNCGAPSCDGVFFTHYHGEIYLDIPMYMGRFSKDLLLIQNERCRLFDTIRLNQVNTFVAGRPIQIKDIAITTYRVDHSAYDAYMYLIEADGKAVLHTGDFRTHGFKGKSLAYVIEHYLPHIDYLICEGTVLSRDKTTALTERRLALKAKEIFEHNKYVFIVCASTNIDRIAALCSAVPRGKYCLCDDYQMKVLELVKKYSSTKDHVYAFKKMLTYGKNLDDKMKKQGFCMFVRAGSPYFENLIAEYKAYNPLIVYSMWQGYLEQEQIQNFIAGYDMVALHTSGHADTQSLTDVINRINPTAVIPIHTELPEAYEKLNITSEVIVLKDGEEIEL